MLTKDLLQYRIRQGRAHPSFIDARAESLRALADELIRLVARSTGTERAELEQQLGARAQEFERPKIAQGLAKLLLDRVTFEPPSDDARALRAETFDRAAEVLRKLGDGASAQEWERALGSVLPDLERRRADLYADHPNERRVVLWRPIDTTGLLDRYNLALVQGLVMRARRLRVEAPRADALRLRKVLRWVKFCRLVADVVQTDDDWSLDIEGPAEVLSMSRKYGLELAIFTSVVPVFERYRLRAELDFGRGETVLLDLTEKSPLAPPTQPLGHVPEEVDVISRKLEDADWKVELTPTPRVVGLGQACVPDLQLTHRATGAELWVEFFHRWHAKGLERRLEALAHRPEPRLLLAADESLLKDPALRRKVEAHPQAMTFKGFPSERKLRALLEANRERVAGKPRRKRKS